MRVRALLVVGALAAATSARAQDVHRLPLREGWGLESSAQAGQGGEVLSQPGFDASAWSRVTVPNTVVGALVENGTYPEPFFGMNLRTLPGMTYPVAKNFSLLPMSPESPFARSWWYRKEFELPAMLGGRALFLHFDGINYRANV
jgi:exo-1,4-beta-D-glucosaminidase